MFPKITNVFLCCWRFRLSISDSRAGNISWRKPGERNLKELTTPLGESHQEFEVCRRLWWWSSSSTAPSSFSPSWPTWPGRWRAGGRTGGSTSQTSTSRGESVSLDILLHFLWVWSNQYYNTIPVIFQLGYWETNLLYCVYCRINVEF